MSAETYHHDFSQWIHTTETEPTAAELAAIEDIESAGWFEQEAVEPVPVTLLELVKAVSEVSKNEAEIIGTVCYMLSAGSVELTGAFRNEPIAQLLASA